MTEGMLEVKGEEGRSLGDGETNEGRYEHRGEVCLARFHSGTVGVL